MYVVCKSPISQSSYTHVKETMLRVAIINLVGIETGRIEFQ